MSFRINGKKIDEIRIPTRCVKEVIEGHDIIGDRTVHIRAICHLKDFEKFTASWSPRLPKKYIINKKAAVLFWSDEDKTIVRRTKGDAHNKRLAFLTAYFQKHSGLSKNKANKYLDALCEEGGDEK